MSKRLKKPDHSAEDAYREWEERHLKESAERFERALQDPEACDIMINIYELQLKAMRELEEERENRRKRKEAERNS